MIHKFFNSTFVLSGNEETPHAQPIPSVTVGYGGDWMSMSPIALQFWVRSTYFYASVLLDTTFIKML